MHRKKLPFAVAATCTGLALAWAGVAPAAADHLGAPESEPAEPEPDEDPAARRALKSVLPNVLATNRGWTVDARADYASAVADSMTADGAPVGASLHAQYIGPHELGGYVSLPFSGSQVGNVELGGIYVAGQPETAVYLRAGLAIDSATERGSAVVPLALAAARPADAIASGNGATWMRIGVGARLSSGALVAGGSAGIDYPLDTDIAIEGGVAHASASLGVVQPRFALSAGLTLVHLLASHTGDTSTLGAQGVLDVPVAARTRIYGAIGLGLGETNDAFSLGVGVRAGL